VLSDLLLADGPASPYWVDSHREEPRWAVGHSVLEPISLPYTAILVNSCRIARIVGVARCLHRPLRLYDCATVDADQCVYRGLRSEAPEFGQ